MAEIGVHHGRLFIAMHLLRDISTRSVAVDVFGDQFLNVDASGKGDEDIFRTNLRRWADEAVEVVAADSTSLQGSTIRQLAGPVRIFSVDGGHTADTVFHDMRTAEESLVAGGLVIGDDVFNPQWPGVVEGTLRYLQSGRLIPFAIGFNKVWLSDPNYADRYRLVVDKLAERRLWAHKASEMAGHPVIVMWRTDMASSARKFAARALRR